MINDVYGLRSEGLAELVAEYGVPVVIMHMKGEPKNMQLNPNYDFVIGEILSFFRGQIEVAKNAGVPNDKIIIDPGIGFGKTRENNLEILRRLREFKSLGYPILIGTSRKTFIGDILEEPPSKRLEGTLASVVVSILNGANIVRVHDIKECFKALQVTNAILGKSMKTQSFLG